MLDGVPFGVEFALLAPTRVFRADERGVTLLPMKAFTGVPSSCTAEVGRGAVPGVLRAVRLAAVVVVFVEEAAEVASRGVTGVFAVRVVAREGFKGREELLAARSRGMVG